MAQNVIINGVTYSNVPEVDIPKSGGGTASFFDVSDTDTVASDVTNGKYFYTAAGVRTQGTSTFSTIHTGSSAPSSSLGVDGDIYIQV